MGQGPRTIWGGGAEERAASPLGAAAEPWDTAQRLRQQSLGTLLRGDGSRALRHCSEVTAAEPWDTAQRLRQQSLGTLLRGYGSRALGHCSEVTAAEPWDTAQRLWQQKLGTQLRGYSSRARRPSACKRGCKVGHTQALRAHLPKIFPGPLSASSSNLCVHTPKG